jgi:hypothetical protein
MHAGFFITVIYRRNLSAHSNSFSAHTPPYTLPPSFILAQCPP